jgi:hypothetical protein
MTLSESLAAPAGRDAPASRSPVEAQVLAAALSHLLRRDEECPARWRTASFVEAVELARRDFRPADAIASRLAPDDDLGRGPGFQDAVSRLARNPGDVAVAIRRLELAERQPLPPWLDLVRHGLPSRPSDLDTALWFG